MTATLRHIGAMTGRVVNQLRHDPRLIGFSIGFPLLIIYFISILFDVLANPLFDISIYVVPYGAFIVHFITYMLTAIVLVRERTSGTLTRMLVNGYTQFEIITGYLLAYSLLVTIQSLLVLVELNTLFELGYQFDLLASIYLIMWLLSVISMALGILVSNLARNEGQVVAFVPVILISFIVSGVLVPIEKMPDWTQSLSYLTPLYYANEVLQELIRGGALGDDLPGLLSLPIYGIIIVGVATLSLRETE